MNKKGQLMYNFKYVFWGFVVGFLIGATLVYLSLKGMLPFKIPFLT